MKAIWNNQIIAESKDTVVVENNHYFPIESVHPKMIKKTTNHYTCPWKGTCDYYDVSVGGQTNKEAAWIYPQPKPEANQIKGRIAFWRGIKVVD